MRPPARQFTLKQAAPRWWIVLALLIGATVYFYGLREDPEYHHRLSGSTMGTTYSVVLSQGLPADALVELQRAVDAELARINGAMSTYDPTSELSRFNLHRSTEPAEISMELAEVVAASLEVSRASGGSFDVTVGPLVDAWGFGPQGRQDSPPTDEAIAALRERVGYDKLTLEGNQWSKKHPDLSVDLSAIAKGYAVDRVARLLEQRGLEDYLVEIGGELRARGSNPEGHPFRVGIEEPDPDSRSIRLAIALGDRALATSGNYRNFFELNGHRYVHTLDPTTGRPAQHTLLSASVIAETCMRADAWATTLMAAGPERAWRLAQDNDLEVLLLIATEGGRIRERATPGFAALDTRPTEAGSR